MGNEIVVPSRRRNGGNNVREVRRRLYLRCDGLQAPGPPPPSRGASFRLREGDEAKYRKVTCQATYVAPYSAFNCFGIPRYTIIYGPSEIRVVRVRLVNGKYVARSIFHVNPSGR